MECLFSLRFVIFIIYNNYKTITMVLISKIYISKYTILLIFMYHYWQPIHRLLFKREIRWSISHIDTDLNQKRKLFWDYVKFQALPLVKLSNAEQSHHLTSLHLN